MDVGVDEARADQPAVALDFFLRVDEPRCDGSDAAVLHADVGRWLVGFGVGQPHIAQDCFEIHQWSPVSARMLHHAVRHL